MGVELVGRMSRKLQLSYTPKFRCTEPYSPAYACVVVFMCVRAHTHSVLLSSQVTCTLGFLVESHLPPLRGPGLHPSQSQNYSWGELEGAKH